MSEHEHCKDYLAQFSDYIDRNLPADFCTQIDEHLMECPDCRIVFNTLQRTVELYQNTPEDEDQLPGPVRSRLFARLHLDDLETGENAQS